MKPSLFYRIAAALLLLFAIGHTLGFRQSDPAWGVAPLLASMRSIHFDVQGFSRTYWDLFLAAGFSVGVFYFVCGCISVAARCSPVRDLGENARHSLGLRSLLCRRYGCELEISLRPAYRFFARDYRVFDCSGMAFRTANENAIAPQSRRRQY